MAASKALIAIRGSLARRGIVRLDRGRHVPLCSAREPLLGASRLWAEVIGANRVGAALVGGQDERALVCGLVVAPMPYELETCHGP